MYQRKQQKRSCRRSGKSVALLVSLLLLLTVTVGGTIAFLLDSDGPLANLFNSSQITTKVEETLNGSIKNDVYIQNTGNTDAWIRAAVIFSWQDKDGNVYGQAPVEGQDFDITWGTGWHKGDDGFYYWCFPVAAKTGVTGDLIESCAYKANAPTDYFLSVEVIGSGIQNKPASVFNNKWGTSSGLTVKDKDDSGNVLDPMQWSLIEQGGAG